MKICQRATCFSHVGVSRETWYISHQETHLPEVIIDTFLSGLLFWPTFS